MKRVSILLSGLFLLFGLCAAANATVIVNTGGTAVLGEGFTTSLSNATVENFNNGITTHWDWNGSYSIVQGGKSGVYGNPAGDNSNYMVTPAEGAGSSGSVALSFGGASFYYLGIYIGSIDSYNTITFYEGNKIVGQFTGLQLSKTADGSWTNASDNVYFNFYSSEGFDKVVFSSTSRALEFDNVAVATPEPGTMLLLGTGLIGLAVFRKRFKKH